MSRSYVIGLPVVITVYDDGTVKAEVDLSEASDLHDSSVSFDQTLEALPDDERNEIMDADIDRIENAVVQARVIVK